MQPNENIYDTLNSNSKEEINVTETIDKADAKDFRILSAYLMTAETTNPPNAA
jgi:hypothetical protein